MLLRWLKHGTADGERRAIAAAASLCLFLWTLKVHLVWWMWWSKGVHVLADVPAATVPLLGAHDLLLCAGLAVIYALVAMLARPLPRGLGQAIAYGVPALIGCAVALFAVISWKVQQLYGCAVEMDHFRAATGISAMRDSIVAYLTAGTIAFLIMAVLTPTLGAYLLARVRWSPPRWRTWFVLLAGSVALYGADKSLMKERYTHGVEQDAVLHFVQWYEPAPRPVDVAEMLRDTPAQVPSRDAEFRRFTPFAPMPQQLGASDQTPTTAGLPLVAPQPTSRPLNVVFILMESVPAMYIDPVSTPNLCHLAETGVRMEHHFTTICETYKAVYSLFFSDYMVNLGSLPRVVYGGAMPQPSLAQVLHDHGYATGFFHSGFLRLGDLGFMLKGFETALSAEQLQKTGEPAWRYGVFEEQTVAALTQWTSEHRQQPFFAVYSMIFPHHPYYCPIDDKPFPIETQLGRYRNALHYADINIGRLISSLKSQGLLDDTLIVAVSDHGETVSTWPCGHGMAFSMEELHVPMIFSNPRRLTAGTRCELFTQHPDIAPTILSLAGIPRPTEWLGRDLSAASVPLRALPVKLEQCKFSGVVDNGTVYRLDEQANRGDLLRIDGEQFTPIENSTLAGAYADRLSLFTPWVRWRHYRRIVSDPVTTPTTNVRAVAGTSSNDPSQ